MSEAKPQSFEEALAALERVVDALEDGSTGLDAALAQYEQGVALLKSCYGKLRQVETRILELTGKDEAGNPATRPFEHVSSMEAVKRNP